LLTISNSTRKVRNGLVSSSRTWRHDRKKIFEYNFVVRLLPEMPDDEVRIIFRRLNGNTMVLNAQELRHATYWGPFIKLMQELADLDRGLCLVVLRLWT
jgi:hypothetical protein